MKCEGEHNSRGDAEEADARPHKSVKTDSAPLLEEQNFGSIAFSEIGVLFYKRLLDTIVEASVALIQAESAAVRAAHVARLSEDLRIVWAVARRRLSEEECLKWDGTVRACQSQLSHDVAAVCGRDHEDALAFARAYLKVVEEHGFVDKENGKIDQLLNSLRQTSQPLGYSYSPRGNFVMPMIPRYDGDKKAEEEHTFQRQGFSVKLPCPHPHGEVNTLYQLSEPKRRKPLLDENKIFSHPKKAAVFGSEDFLVDEDLLHRSYVVLLHHLDCFGSLEGLSPFARFSLWNLLGRDDDAFAKVNNVSVSSDGMIATLKQLRRDLHQRLRSFEATRAASREAAQQIGWYAVSAQWRDQILHKLLRAEEEDWCYFGELERYGGSVIFPNYAPNDAIAGYLVALLLKLEKKSGAADKEVSVLSTVQHILLPLLQGSSFDTLPWSEDGAQLEQGEPTHWARARRRTRHWFGEKASAPRTTRDHGSRPGGGGGGGSIISPSFLFPLQCLAELLELCTCALCAVAGIENFMKSFLAAAWEDEEGIVNFLLKKEPHNVAIAPLVALPRVYKDLVTGIQILRNDKMLPYLFESRRVAGEHHLRGDMPASYAYWKAVSLLLQEEGRSDDLYLLQAGEPSKPDAKRFSIGSIEMCPYVWDQDLRELIGEEKKYRERQHIDAHKGTE